MTKGDNRLPKIFFAAALVVVSVSASSFAAEKTVTLAVEHMTCAACPHIVKGSLAAVPGVSAVVVSFEDKTATVTYDDARTAIPTLIRATTDAGYPSAPKS
jgi:mercuric ion binding protein